MTLNELLSDLIYGEYRAALAGNISDDPPYIDSTDLKNIITALNMTLLDLYQQFKIKTGELTLQITPDTTVYTLNSAYSETNGGYILDSADPFKDDIIKIERLYDPDHNEFILNKINNKNSFSTPGTTLLKVPRNTEVLKGIETVLIIYRARHVRIDPFGYTVVETPYDFEVTGNILAQDVDIEIPQAYKRAVLLGIAYRRLLPTAPIEGFHLGTNYYQLYTAELQKLSNINVENDWDYESDPIQCRGWV